MMGRTYLKTDVSHSNSLMQKLQCKKSMGINQNNLKIQYVYIKLCTIYLQFIIFEPRKFSKTRYDLTN